MTMNYRGGRLAAGWCVWPSAANRQPPTAIAAVALVMVSLMAALSAQEQPPQTTFRSSVDLVPVDVSVIDKTGRPVRELTAGDFVLNVDGKPRRIVSAEYISATRELSAVPAPTTTDFSSNLATGGGRLIMIVVDRGNIGLGRGRQTLQAATKFVTSLPSGDRVALVGLPGTGPQFEFTANHAIVAQMLPSLVGNASSLPVQHLIGVSEAFRLQRGDRMVMDQIITRECTTLREPGEIERCREMVEQDARLIYSAAKERAHNSLLALRSLIERISVTPTPKTVIFISEGLVIDREFDDLMWLGPHASRGQVVLHVLQLNEPHFDASEARMSPTRGEDLALGEDGLYLMAGLARGSVQRVVANADFAFNRLGLELSGYYPLSFEPEGSDRDGKAHKIKVELPKRSGIEIRARTEFAVNAGATKDTEAVLADVIRSPLLSNDIPLKLSTYTLRDPASGKLRILLVAEIDRAVNPEGRLSLGYTLVDDRGRTVSAEIDRDVKVAVDSTTKTQTYTAFLLSESSGPHTMKLAVVDDRGRKGSVEHAFRAALTSAGQLRATDLLIAERGQSESESAMPVIGRELTSGTMHGYIELYSEAAEVLNNTTVVFEIAKTAEERALDGAAGRITPQKTESPNRRVIEGSIPTALLPPGEYVARAVLSLDGKKVGQVTRPLRIGRTVATPVRTTSTLGVRSPTTRGPIPFVSRIEKFDRGAVLASPVVSFFLDRMNFGARGEANAAPALEHAHAGRFDEAVKSLGTGTLPSTFISGLALYAKGELEAAANKFRDTLRLDSEFFPAAFYLGSCYAAGGRDQEAVGAWQLSLVTESDAPFIYTLLGDALLRLRQGQEAIQILNEAQGIWPESEEVQVRMAAALSMTGRRAESLQLLEPYLAKHPEDAERHFLGLRTLYEAKSEGKVVRSKDEDKALFAKWAAAYAAAKGPQTAVVEQWQRAINR
jgi:VWFA-related protein